MIEDKNAYRVNIIKKRGDIKEDKGDVKRFRKDG
jgi:hypothetical protein